MATQQEQTGNPWGTTMELIPRLRGGLFTSTEHSWENCGSLEFTGCCEIRPSPGCNKDTATHKL